MFSLMCLRPFIFFICFITPLLSVCNSLPKDSLIAQIQGAWKCVKIVESCETEEPKNFCILPGKGALYVKSDSIFLFDYPCNYYFGSLLYNNGSLRFDNNLKVYNTKYTELKLAEDTLLLHRNTGGKYGRNEYYIRSNLNIETLSRLKKDSINFECFYGKWQLVTYMDLGDGSDPNIKFPFKLPTVLDFTDPVKFKKALLGKHHIKIKVDGVLRVFTIKEISRTTGMLWLDEGRWWQGKEVPFIKYRLQK